MWFVEALQDNRSVSPYWGTTNTTNLVPQYGLQISGILADDFPAVEERILQECLSGLVANFQLRGERIATKEYSPATFHQLSITVTSGKTDLIVLQASLW